MDTNSLDSYTLFELIRAYCYLAKLPTLSPKQAEQMQAILELAYYDDELNLRISEANDLIDYDLATSQTTASKLSNNGKHLYELNGNNEMGNSDLLRSSITDPVNEEREPNLGNVILCETTLVIQAPSSFLHRRNFYSLDWLPALLRSRLVRTITRFIQLATPQSQKQTRNREIDHYSSIPTKHKGRLIYRIDIRKETIHTTYLRSLVLLLIVFLNGFGFSIWQAKHWKTIPEVRSRFAQELVPTLPCFFAIAPS